VAIDLFFGVDTSANKSFPIANEWGGLLEQEKKKGAGNLKLLSKQQKGGKKEKEKCLVLTKRGALNGVYMRVY
jgi:hypothetical protein